MPIDVAALVAPAHTAVVTSECQNSVIGSVSLLPELAAAAAATVIPNGARVCAAAREAGVNVVHCVAGRRSDDRGSNSNARLFSALLKSPVKNLFGTPATEVIEEFGVVDSDLILSRIHGLNPMAGTDLDPVLRNLGATTLVVLGVSVNVAITNLVMDAINLGYQVVLVRDAVCGVPKSYADAVLDNTLSLLATVVTTDELLGYWRA
ncbi:MAG TPA: cysteine hydrolase [Mycobacteriales bacterium]|jgi:nicotinamidase-related amidase|nr:cysteine hydrolase [Mycobacteriales bacterium]